MVDTGTGNDDEHAEGSNESSEVDSEVSLDDSDAASASENNDKQEGPSRPAVVSSQGVSQGRRRKPAWTDPASASLVVSLAGDGVRTENGSYAGSKKLRKLRETPTETQVSGIEYEMRLRRMFEKLHPRPSWASLEKRTGDEAVSSGNTSLAHLLGRDSGLVKGASKGDSQRKTKKLLPPGKLDVQRVRNANEAQGRASLSSIEALQFHPSPRAHVLLTASKDRRLRLFQINGSSNPHLETIHLPDLPLKTAQFDPRGSSIIMSGPRPFFYVHDLDAGKTVKSTPWRSFGTNEDDAHERDLSNIAFSPHGDRRLAVGGRRGAVHLLDWGTLGGSGGGSLLGSCKMNAPLADMAWDPRREHSLATLSSQGTIHTWDVRNLTCELQRHDSGLFSPTTIQPSPMGGDWWTVGSDTGIVNIYGRDAVDGSGKGSLQPRKSLENIVTSTTTLQFNPTGQILAMASSKKKDALKLVSMNVVRASIMSDTLSPAGPLPYTQCV